MIRLIADTSPDHPERIDAYMHCRMCIEERPGDTTPRDWARLNVGLRHDGKLQVWCTRHDANVAIIRCEEVHS